MNAAFSHHGGALDAARRLFPDAPRPWLDLSTGINPHAYPFAAPPAHAWARLPGAAALAACEAAAARRYGVSQGTDAGMEAGMEVVAVPGTQAAIARLPELLGGVAGADVRIASPTYGEFASVFRDAGARLRPTTAVADLAGADVAVVVNPNNPDGRLVGPVELLRLASRVGTLIVDEAFADALPPGASVLPELSRAKATATRLVVLRSFGKFYGLAGLRLGFVVAAPDRAARLRRMMGPWAVSGPALRIGAEALADAAWAAAARDRLRGDGARLDRMLAAIGARPLGGTPLFRLVGHPAAAGVFRHLASLGILARPFDGEPTWLRFGLPGEAAAWARLAEALAGFR